MLQGFRLRTRCFGFALVALAIQAITPDSRDFTSNSISRILQSLVADELPPTDAAVPPGEDSQDEKADEVCAPASAGPQIVLRRSANGSTGHNANATQPSGCPPSPGCLRSSRPFGGIARTGELIFLLCRLTC